MIVGQLGARRRTFSSNQTLWTSVSSTSNTQTSASPCARKGSASSSVGRCKTRYCSGSSAARTAPGRSGLCDNTRRVFINGKKQLLRRRSRSTDRSYVIPHVNLILTLNVLHFLNLIYNFG